MKIIDTHVHVGLSDFCKNTNTDSFYNLNNDYKDFVQLMDRNHIDRAVILPIPHKDFDSDLSNDYLISAYREYPYRFIPFCRIDKKLEDNIKRGFKGAKLHLVYEEVEISQIKNELLILEEFQVPLIVHALYKDKAKQIKKMLNIAPNLIITLAHMGRGHIYTDEHVVENAIALKKNDNVYFETSTVGNISAIEEVCNIIGDDRVIFGSDFPFGKAWFKDKKPYDYKDELELFINSNISQSSIEKILYTNAYNLLDLDEKPDRIIVRKIKKSDLEQVNNLITILCEQDRKFLALEPKMSLIRQQIRNERHCYVATSENEIVGFMRESGRPEGYSLLEELLVHPEHRRQGIAKKMLRYYHRIFPKTLAKTNAKNENIMNLLKNHRYNADNPNAQRIINWTRCDE